MNKVKFGLKNVHYATFDVSDGVVVYSTPKHVPGAVNLSLSVQGSADDFFADNMVYFSQGGTSGYEGDLEMALIPDDYRKDVFGDKEDANGVLFEDANAITKPIALLFQFEGDKKGTRHVLYNVTTGRPNVASATTDTSKTPQTETMSISAKPAEDTGLIKGRAQQGDVPYEDWFKKVYTYAEKASPADTSLSALSLGAATLTPAFASDTLNYTAVTANATNAITATAANAAATVKITADGQTVENGGSITWADGENVVQIVVSIGAASTTYTITVTKE